LTQEKKGKNERKAKKWDEGKEKRVLNIEINLPFLRLYIIHQNF
jgi:hypothetical protein